MLDIVATLRELIEYLTELSSAHSSVHASSPPQDLPMLLDAKEAAKLLTLSRAKVCDMASRGEIPSVRVGRSLRIPRDRLVAWVNDRTAEPDSLIGRKLPAWSRGDRSLER